MIGIFHKIGKSMSKAGEILTGIGPTPSKQFKNAILEEDEEKAITIYTSVENEKCLLVDLHPSQPFPTKKINQLSETPLHLASKYGLIKLVLLLLKHGGDPSNTNSRNESCLHCVCSQPNNPQNRAALIDELVNWSGTFTLLDGSEQPMEKVSVNHIDVDGNAAIHYAAASGLLQCVEKLVLLGAIISIVNKANITCCEMADEKDHKQLALMLELALVFQPVDESMLAFDSFQFDFDGVPGKVLLSTVSLTLGGVNDFIEDAIRFVGQVVGGDLLKYRCRTEVLLEASNWDVETMVQQYVEDPEKMLKAARLEPIRTQEERDADKEREKRAAASPVAEKIESPAKVTSSSVESDETSPSVNEVAEGSSSVLLSEDLIEVSFLGDDEPDTEESSASIPAVALDENMVDIADLTTTTSNALTSAIEASVSQKRSLKSELDATQEPSTSNNLMDILSAAHLDVTTTTEECTICGDNMLRSVDVTHFNKGDVLEADRRELRCLSGHAYCVSCWSAHLHVQVSDKGLGCMPCPGYKCGEILNTQWAPVMLKSQELVNRLLLQRQRHVVDISGLKSCPVEACGLFVCVPCKPRASNRISTPSRPVVEHTVPLAVVCGNGHSFCLSCAQVAHSPLSCADFPNWHTQVQEETKNSDLKEGSSGDDMANAMWVAANTKRCPRCSTPIEKDEGCNHMCCRKCRKEFCWICMQDWNLHSDNTGGYFQCNRYRETPQGENDVFAEEMGSAAAETMRLRNKGARMARFIHYFTRFQAHRDSVKMEGRMQKETMARIADGLRASRDGKLRWLQQGNGVLNPLLAVKSPSAAEVDNPHEKNDSNGNSSSSSSQAPVTRQTSRNKEESTTVTLSTHAMKADVCLSFLADGFEELLKCRDILQWSYPYAYFEFEERSLNDYSSFIGFDNQTRRQRQRKEDHRTSFELLQADLESMVETLSDVVARRRLRAGQNQISLATRAAKSKRLELETVLIGYSIAKQDKGAANGGFTPPPTAFSTPAREAPRIRTGGSVQQRSDGSRRSGSRSATRHSPQQRQRQSGAQAEDSDEEIDLATLLMEMEMASTMAESSSSGARDGTVSTEQISVDRQRAADMLRLRINEMLNPQGALHNSGTFDFQPANLFAPPPVPPNGENAGEDSVRGTTPVPTAARGSRRSVGERNSTRTVRIRHRDRERSSEAATSTTSANSSPMSHATYSSLPRPPEPPRSRSTRSPGQILSDDDSADGDLLPNDNENEGEEGEDDEDDDVGQLIRNIESSAANSPDRRRHSANGITTISNVISTPDNDETGGRVARDVASEMRLARLTRRAEEEASLNRAILMSLQDPARRNSEQSMQSEADIECLMNMGFPREDAIQALRETRNNVELAANRLLGV